MRRFGCAVKREFVPVMITGDHPATAFAIARELQIAKDDDKVITAQNSMPSQIRVRYENFSVLGLRSRFSET